MRVLLERTLFQGNGENTDYRFTCGGPMTGAIILDPQELIIAKRQCGECLYWDWFKGCSILEATGDPVDPHPIQDCEAFEETP